MIIVTDIPLEANSVYIATQILDEFSTERFHWSFLITAQDPAHVVQHHWNVILGKEGYESYQSRPLILSPSPSADDTPQVIYLTFTRLPFAWTSPPLSDLQSCLQAIYGDRTDIHYSLNRQKDWSCRTWIVSALLRFAKNRWMEIPSKEDWLAVEPAVVRSSRQAARRYKALLNAGETSSFQPDLGQIDLGSQ